MDPTDLIEAMPDDQRRRRQRLRRTVIPVACVILMLGAILAIATFSYQRNRWDALALSDDLLRELQRRIATEVKGYLAPAAPGTACQRTSSVLLVLALFLATRCCCWRSRPSESIPKDGLLSGWGEPARQNA